MKNLIAFALLLGIIVAPFVSQAGGKNRVHVVKMERTSCLDHCPWYVVQIFEDGRVTYYGKEGAPRQGYFEAKIDPLEADALMEKFENRKVRNAQDQYNRTMANVAALNFQLGIGEDLEMKTIRQANFGPSYLIDLGKEIDLLLKDVVWKRAAKEDNK